MLTKMQRKLLIEARRLIETGREEFVCLALKEAASMRGSGYDHQYLKLRQYITRVLNEGRTHGHISTLDDWQRRHRIRHTDSGKRRDRMRWIDWMLE